MGGDGAYTTGGDGAYEYTAGGDGGGRTTRPPMRPGDDEEERDEALRDEPRDDERFDGDLLRV